MHETAWEVFVRRYLAGQPFANRANRLQIQFDRHFWGRHEISFVVFTAAGRSLPAQSSGRDGAVDTDAGGKAEPRASAIERRILWAARDAGRIDHRRGLAGDGDGARKPRYARHLFGATDQGLARCRRRGPRQGRIDLSPALACRTRLALLVPARRRAAGRTIRSTDFGDAEDDDG